MNDTGLPEFQESEAAFDNGLEWEVPISTYDVHLIYRLWDADAEIKRQNQLQEGEQHDHQ